MPARGKSLEVVNGGRELPMRQEPPPLQVQLSLAIEIPLHFLILSFLCGGFFAYSVVPTEILFSPPSPPSSTSFPCF